MSDDRLLAAMYNLDDRPSRPLIQPQDMRSRRIRVGIADYEVPTMEYVRHLEQLIVRQGDMLDQQRRTIERLITAIQGTRRFARHQTIQMGDLRDFSRTDYR